MESYDCCLSSNGFTLDPGLNTIKIPLKVRVRLVSHCTYMSAYHEREVEKTVKHFPNSTSEKDGRNVALQEHAIKHFNQQTMGLGKFRLNKQTWDNIFKSLLRTRVFFFFFFNSKTFFQSSNSTSKNISQP